VYGVSTPLSVEVQPMLLKKSRRSSSAVMSARAVVISRPATELSTSRFERQAGSARFVTASGRKVGRRPPSSPIL